MELVGCDINYLRKHLEKQFEPWMSWNNHSTTGWHFDHMQPCASFDLNDKNQQKICFNYKNLRPLKAIENLKKGSKIPSHVRPNKI